MSKIMESRQIKKLWSILPAVALLSFCLIFFIPPETVQAEPSYSFNSDTGTLTITGDGTIYSSGISSAVGESSYYYNYIKKVIIQNGITGIGSSAFSNCYNLTSITIPNSVTSIGSSAFSGCYGLTSITIPSSVTKIGNNAFYGCSGLTSITIPYSVTSIGTGAFSSCNNLTSMNVDGSNTSYNSSGGCNAIIETASNTLIAGCKKSSIPGSVKSIGSYAFYGCSGMTSMTIPGNVTTIGTYAYYGCSKLSELTIPASVTSIGYYAFYGCSALPEITIPGSVTSIGTYAFYGCSKLSSITIPASVTSIGTCAFSSCTDLGSITVEGSNTTYNSSGGCNAIIETASNTLIVGCKNTTIPGSVTGIGNYAFHSCTGLSAITIPTNVTSIGANAFYGCSGLSEITIPASVTSIGTYAFSSCSKLSEITIQYGVTSIEEYAFYGCSKLSEITIPASVTEIGSYAFYVCSGLSGITINDGVTSIGDYAFYGCSKLSEVTIPASITNIGIGVFSSCTDLNSIIVEESNTTYNSSGNCNAIIETASNTLIEGCKNTTIPATVTSIGSYAFRGCSVLSEIEIPGSVTSINGYAFYSCSGLTEIKIPVSVTSIGGSAFYSCSKLSDVYYGGTEDEWKAVAIGTNNSSLTSATIHYNSIIIPECTVSFNSNGHGSDPESQTILSGNKVKRPENPVAEGYIFGGWYMESSCTTYFDFNTPVTGDIILYAKWTEKPVEYGVAYIFDDDTGTLTISGNGAVESSGVNPYRDAVKTVIILDGITDIGDDAFSGCSSLTSITIPENVTGIGRFAFYGCVKMPEIIIPYGVTDIGMNAFSGCISLAKISIPESLTTIEQYAFSGCSSLTSIVIPDSVTDIGESAFSGCNGLTALLIQGGDINIGDEAFSECTGLTTITMHGGKISIGNYAFGGCCSLDSLIIVDSEISIGTNAFNDCGSLTSLTIPGCVTGIGNSAFIRCNMTTMTIKDGITEIGEMAFFDCSGLVSMALPKSITEIGEAAFCSCLRLSDVYYAGTKEEWEAITIGEDNTELKSATIHYNSDGIPEFTVSFNSMGHGETPDPQSVTGGFKAMEPAAPMESEYVFGGWYTEESCVNAYDFNAPVRDNLTLYAKWTANTYDVILVTNGGTVKRRNITEYAYGTGAILPTEVKKTGHTFDGWYENEDLSGLPVKRISAADTGPKTYYAKWKINSYMITFKANGHGKAPDTQTALYNTTVSDPGIPEEDGYIFEGWYREKSCVNAYDFSTPVTGNLVLYAKWTPEEPAFVRSCCITTGSEENGYIYEAAEPYSKVINDRSKEGEIKLSPGDTKTFIIRPDSGFLVEDILVDGSSVLGKPELTVVSSEAGSYGYTFENIQNDHTLTATYAEIIKIEGAGNFLVHWTKSVSYNGRKHKWAEKNKSASENRSYINDIQISLYSWDGSNRTAVDNSVIRSVKFKNNKLAHKGDEKDSKSPYFTIKFNKRSGFDSAQIKQISRHKFTFDINPAEINKDNIKVKWGTTDGMADVKKLSLMIPGSKYPVKMKYTKNTSRTDYIKTPKDGGVEISCPSGSNFTGTVLLKK